MNTTPNAQAPSGCGRQEELVTYLYDEANASERAAFEQHLDECAACRHELRAFERLRQDLNAWQLPLAPRVEIAPPRRVLDVLRELFGLLPVWSKLAAAAAMAVVVLAAAGTRVSLGPNGASADFGGRFAKASEPRPSGTITRAEAEALVKEAVARTQTQAQEETRAQLASLEQRLNAAREAELTTVQAQLKQLRFAHRTLLANTRQEPTIREWLFAANESRDAGGSENERND